MQKDHLDHVAMTTGGVSGVRVIKEMCRATFRDAPCTQGDVGEQNTNMTGNLFILKLDMFAINFCSFFSCIML